MAIHSLESTFSKVDSRNALFANAKSMDCHADKSARNDSELDSSVDCRATASAVSRNDYKNAAFQNEDSRENAQSLNESHAEAKVDSMDCHATASAVSRNDNKNAVFQKVDSSNETNLNESAQDSRIFAKNAKNLSNSQAEAKLDSSKSPSDSKILELESGLFEPHKENKTRGLLTQCGDEIHDSSPKAESLLKVAYAA